MRRRRVAVAETAQVLFDTVARILQKILVRGRFPFHRDELFAAVGRQRVACEYDADARSFVDGEPQIGDMVGIR